MHEFVGLINHLLSYVISIVITAGKVFHQQSGHSVKVYEKNKDIVWQNHDRCYGTVNGESFNNISASILLRFAPGAKKHVEIYLVYWYTTIWLCLSFYSFKMTHSIQFMTFMTFPVSRRSSSLASGWNFFMFVHIFFFKSFLKYLLYLSDHLLSFNVSIVMTAGKAGDQQSGHIHEKCIGVIWQPTSRCSWHCMTFPLHICFSGLMVAQKPNYFKFFYLLTYIK